MFEKKYILAAAAVAAVFYFASYFSGFYVDYAWFAANSAEESFWVLFFAKFNVHLLFWGIFIALFFLNFLLIRVLAGKGRIFTNNILDRLKLPMLGTPKRALFILLVLIVVAVGFLMGGAASAYWKEYLIYLNSSPFSGFPKDPIFAMDISFYTFDLPFYQFLYGWMMSSLLIITAFSFFFHFLNGGIMFGPAILEFSLFARAHISTLLASIVLLFGAGYRISAYELMFSKAGKFFGPGYTAVNAKLLAYNACLFISVVAAAILLFNIFKRSFRLAALVILLLIPAYLILGVVYPAIQQRFFVEPNELDMERPYIENNIKFSRIAYGIDRVKEIPFSNSLSLKYQDILKNRDTLENIRLWDWKPLSQTYKQLQELKPYYVFNDLDVDRYVINGKKIAVNLAARELNIDRLGSNSQTWLNRHLIYTHGFGIALNRVDKVTQEGLPEMLIYDIPPKFKVPLKVDRPEIYYGEHKNDYIITNTTINPGEFDYPFGDENKYTIYKGTGGLKLDSFLKRMIFAIYFRDINILISGNINNSSRIHFNRNITRIAETLTPYLDLDGDPYIVISEGKLYWMIDAYTSSRHFPYSSPAILAGKKINYVRNSVKIVIDAYNGKISYYISDPTDPIIKTYAKVFKGLFRDMKEMPEDLKNHVRYPEDFFNIQSHMLLRYHMTNPNVFYNNEDLWEIPKQVTGKQENEISSYYLVTKLPGEKNGEFIQMIPFTPYKKNNMIAFLSAKCDRANYGELKLYVLPKEKLSYGPMQIEARIDQDSEISKQLTLWNQKGSSVIRGKIMAIPIEESIVYIEPLYLKADASEMPELKKVIVSFADRISMENDLGSALEKLFYSGSFNEPGRQDASSQMRLKELATKALNHYNRAEKSLQSGDWATYGEELKKLRETLQYMNSAKE